MTFYNNLMSRKEKKNSLNFLVMSTWCLLEYGTYVKYKVSNSLCRCHVALWALFIGIDTKSSLCCTQINGVNLYRYRTWTLKPCNYPISWLLSSCAKMETNKSPNLKSRHQPSFFFFFFAELELNVASDSCSFSSGIKPAAHLCERLWCFSAQHVCKEWLFEFLLVWDMHFPQHAL